MVKAQDIYRVTELFKEKEWPITGESGDSISGIGSDVFENVMRLIVTLDNQEKELFLSLLRKFNKYPEKAYTRYIKKLLKKIPKNKLNEYNRVYIVPLRRGEDKAKIKSSTHVTTLAKYIVSPQLEWDHEKFNFLNSHEELDSVNVDTSTLIIALEDFIGSGRTALKFFEEVTDRYGIDNGQILIATIVCMERGFKYLEEKNIEIYYEFKEFRGINDNDLISNKLDAMETLRKMTDLIDTKTHYRGHHKTEALVSLLNTPNSTLPIFWSKKTKSGYVWYSPFNRT